MRELSSEEIGLVSGGGDGDPTAFCAVQKLPWWRRALNAIGERLSTYREVY